MIHTYYESTIGKSVTELVANAKSDARVEHGFNTTWEFVDIDEFANEVELFYGESTRHKGWDVEAKVRVRRTDG